jgi:hypothetical protein
MQRRMEEEQSRQQAALEAERAQFERDQARALAALERERTRLNAAAAQAAWHTYAKPHHDLRQRYAALAQVRAAEQHATNAEIAALRARLAEREEDAPARLVA